LFDIDTESRARERRLAPLRGRLSRAGAFRFLVDALFRPPFALFDERLFDAAVVRGLRDFVDDFDARFAGMVEFRDVDGPIGVTWG